MTRCQPGGCGLLLLLMLMLGPAAFGDAIVISRAVEASTIAEVYVEREGARVELEIGIPDFPTFRNLLPETLLTRLGIEASPLSERLPRFCLEDLTLRINGGPPIPGVVQRIEGRERTRRDDITGEPLPATGAGGDSVLVTTLFYPFKSHPETVSIKPPMGTGGLATATIGFVAYHRGLAINDFRYLSHEETIDLDWEDPWYSRFRNRNLWRTYDAPLNVFLYVEPYEVRVEVIVRPRDLQAWLDVGVPGQTVLSVSNQQSLIDRTVTFLHSKLELVVDGRPVTPEPARAHFLRRTLRASTVVDPPEDLDLNTATLGVIFSHSTTGLPRRADLAWSLFPEKFPMVRAAATDEAGPMPYRLTPDDNVLSWKNFLTDPTLPALVNIPVPTEGVPTRLPILSLLLFLAGSLAITRAVSQAVNRRACIRGAAVCLLLGVLAWPLVSVPIHAWPKAPSLDPTDMETITSSLLRNVYVAFDFRGEEAIYDTLARSTSGDLLTQVYLETRQSLELQSQGGARVKVKQVELLELIPEPLKERDGFAATCTWTIRGAVGHWGHIHQRTNRYQAIVTVRGVDGRWRITDLNVLQEERLP